MKLLVARRTDLETTWQGRTPLLQATCWGNADVIRVLLDARADRNARSEGMDAVGFAKKYGQKDALAALKERSSNCMRDSFDNILEQTMQ